MCGGCLGGERRFRREGVLELLYTVKRVTHEFVSANRPGWKLFYFKQRMQAPPRRFDPVSQIFLDAWHFDSVIAAKAKFYDQGNKFLVF